MKALTLHQSWAWAIMHGDKRVENRSWKPNKKYYGQRIAIHAGSNKGHKDVQAWIRKRHKQAPADKWPTGIVGTVKVLGVVHKDGRGRTSYEGVDNLAARMKVRAAMRSPHFHGPYAWVLDDARPLQVPVQHNGKLMLWEPDKWKHSHADERPPRNVIMNAIKKTASAMGVSGTGTGMSG